MYVAPRGCANGSTRARANTLEGPGTIAQNMYWRSNFVDIQAPAAYKVVNELQTVAKSNMCMMDPVMVGACKDVQGVDDKRKVCTTAIVTAGSPKDGYGFCNSFHLDGNDNLHKESVTRFVAKVGSLKLSDPRFLKKKSYVLRWINKFGRLSVPTTCAYEFLGSFCDLPTIAMAFFMFPPLGIAMLLQSGSALQFYGAVVQHLTAAPVSVSMTHVYYSSDGGCILAWGEGGGRGVNDGPEKGGDTTETEREDSIAGCIGVPVGEILEDYDDESVEEVHGIFEMDSTIDSNGN